MMRTARPRVQSRKGSRLLAPDGAVAIRAGAAAVPGSTVREDTELSKSFQSGLNFAAGMQISDASGGFNALPVERARFFDAAQLRQRLAPVEVGGGVIGIESEK